MGDISGFNKLMSLRMPNFSILSHRLRALNSHYRIKALQKAPNYSAPV